MKKKYLRTLFSVFIIAFLAGCGENPNVDAVSTDSAVVKGTVRVSNTAPLSAPGMFDRAMALRAQAVGTIPIPGAVCAIEGTDKKDITDENGYFEIRGVSHGTHIIICSKTLADGNSYTLLKVIDIARGSTVDIGTQELTFGGNIQGTATMEGRTDQSGIKVFIPGTSYQALTDSVGSYLIKNVPAGTYALQFEHAGFKTAALGDVAVSTGGTSNATGVQLLIDTGPTGGISINNGAAYSTSQNVTITITASNDALLMMISEDLAFVGAEWRAVAGSVDYTFASDGQKRIYIKFSNANGLQSGTVTADIVVDSTAPTGAAIAINENAATTSTQDVTLALSATDAATAVSQMLIDNDASFTDAAWEAFSGTRAWTLPAGDGAKTVYAKFRDAAGNETGVVSASIMLESSMPTTTPAASGVLDTAFGTNGKVYLHAGTGSAFLFSTAVQTDGKIVAGGYSYYFTGSSSNIQFLLMRFNSDGTLDTGFGNGSGMVTTTFGNWGAISALTIQPDGKIVAAGNTSAGFGAARYNSDGSLDTAFGTNGMATVSLSASSYGCQAIGLQSDGKIVLAGYAWNGLDLDMAVVRLTATGTLDTTFNGTGKIMTHAGTRHNVAYAMAIQGDNKIVVGGYADTAQGRNFALLRYNGDGSLDSTFGTGGLVTTALGSYSVINALAIQADGKIVASGTLGTADLGGNHWIVALT